MNNTIHAYTEPGSDLPAFVNIRAQDGKFILSVRSRGSGMPSEIEMDQEGLEELAADVFNHFMLGVISDLPAAGPS